MTEVALVGVKALTEVALVAKALTDVALAAGGVVHVTGLTAASHSTAGLFFNLRNTTRVGTVASDEETLVTDQWVPVHTWSITPCPCPAMLTVALSEESLSAKGV